MKKLILGLICILSLTLLQLTAGAQAGQSSTVTGRVLDKQKNPLQGVTVAEVDAEQRTVRAVSTDVEGNFAIRISNRNDKLNFSFIGFKSITLAIGTRAEFNVNLESNAKDLGEVVVVAQRKSDNGMVPIPEKELTTAASRVNAKDLEEMAATSIDQALQGRMPGVDIAANSGDPGAGMQIRIRGTNSINSSNDPLIVVDGMPYETSIPADFNFGTADEQGYASLLNIAPSDIKEITVLRDAAATAVWGSRAANGVLVITTKRGAVSKPNLSYTFKGTASRQPEAIPMLSGDQYSSLIPEEYMNRNGAPLNTQTIKEFQYDPNDPYWYYNYGQNTNWVDAITRIGYSQDHNMSMNGGGERARYYASVGYLNQKGTTIGTDLNRISTRINLDYNVSNRIRFKTDLSFGHTVNNRLYSDNVRNVAYNKMPNMSIYEYNEYGIETPNYFSPANNVQGQYSGTYNPVAMASAASYQIITDRVTPKFSLQYDIVKSILQAQFDVQFDINNTKNRTFLPQIATGRPVTETQVNRAYDGDVEGYNVTSKSNLIYTPKFKNQKHNLLSYLSFYTYDYKSSYQEAVTSNTASSELQDPSIPSRTQNSDLNLSAGSSETRNLAVTLSGQYKFDDRYIINLAARGEGHSRFGPAHRYGLFPSVSARYVLLQEPFMKSLTKKLDDLSIRASWGQSGNAPRRDYSFYNIYGNYSFSYMGLAGVYPSNMQLDNLKWETIVGQNLGFNVATKQNRINLDVNVYKNRTLNLFFNGLQISSFTGFSSVDMNVGTMDNNGFEIGLNTIPYKSKKVTVGFDFNLARNINMIREISPNYPTERGTITSNGNYKTFMQVDNPFGSFYGFKYKGVYKDKDATIAKDEKGMPIYDAKGQPVYMQFNYPTANYTFQPGDAIYEDVNHDGNINYMDIVYLGNSNPTFTGGFGSRVSWNGLTLSAFFSYRYDYDVVNGTKMTTTNMYGYNNQSTAVLRRWRKEGDVTDMPRALYGSGYNWLGSDRYVEDASFLRFRTLTLRYNAPKAFTSRMKAKSLSAYVTVENLFTWTNYTGQDPEVSVRGSDPFRVASDNSMTPPVKTITIGLTGTF